MGNENKYEGLDAYAVKIIKHKARQLVGSAGFVEADRHDLEQELIAGVRCRIDELLDGCPFERVRRDAELGTSCSSHDARLRLHTLCVVRCAGPGTKHLRRVERVRWPPYYTL